MPSQGRPGGDGPFSALANPQGVRVNGVWRCKNCLTRTEILAWPIEVALAPPTTIFCPLCRHEIQYDPLWDEDVFPERHLDPEEESGALGEGSEPAGDPAEGTPWRDEDVADRTP